MNNRLVYIRKYLILEYRKFGNRGLFNILDTNSKSSKVYLDI